MSLGNQLVESIDISILLFITSWIYVKSKFQSKFDSVVDAINSKFMLFMLTVSYILQMYLGIILVSLLLILILLLIKFTILDQIASVANGIYPYSTEDLSKSLLSFFVSKAHLTFYLSLFVILIVIVYITINFLLGSLKNASDKKYALELLFDVILNVALVSYVVWISSNTKNEMAIISAISLLMGINVLLYFLRHTSKGKKQEDIQ